MPGLFATAAPTAKFKNIGDTVEGEIIDAYQYQDSEYVRNGVGQPLYWHNRRPTPGMRIDPATGRPNDPVLRWQIVLDTGMPDEDGRTERRLFLSKKRLEDGLKRAIIAARAHEGLLLGGHLRCTFTGFDETSDALQLPKTFEFVYTAPAAGKGRRPSGEVRLAERDHEEPSFDLPVTPAAPAFDPPQAPLRNHEVNPLLQKLGVEPLPADAEPPF